MSRILSDRNLRLRKGHTLAGRTFYNPVVRIECADGCSLSVQANEHAYCKPRDNAGPWTHFEVGYPSVAIPEFMEWAENADDPTGTVYALVPGEVIEKVIAAHGGMKEGA